MSSEIIWEKLLWKNTFFWYFLYFERNFSTLGNAIRQRLSKLPSTCAEKNFEDFSLQKGWFFISFCTLSKIIADFCQNFTAAFPKFQSTCPEKKFEWKKWKKDDFLVTLYFEGKKFGTWANKFRQVLPKLHSACPGELLEEIKISGKKNGFLVLLLPSGKICCTLSKKIHELLAKKCVVFLRNLFYVSSGRFWRNPFLKMMIFL